MQRVVPEPGQCAGLSLSVALETCAGSPSGFVLGPTGVRLELFYEMVVVTEISTWCLSFHVLHVTCSMLFITYLLQLKGFAASDCLLLQPWECQLSRAIVQPSGRRLFLGAFKELI